MMAKVPGIPGGINPFPAQMAQLQAPTIHDELVLHHCVIQVLDTPDRKVLRFVTPTGSAYSIPLTSEACESIVQSLKGSNIAIARAMQP
jgi:hypothetical protein